MSHQDLSFEPIWEDELQNYFFYIAGRPTWPTGIFGAPGGKIPGVGNQKNFACELSTIWVNYGQNCKVELKKSVKSETP